MMKPSLLEKQVNWPAENSGQLDVVVVMDADGSMRPEEIPLLIHALASGADIGKGSRFLPGGGSEDLTFIRRLGNKFLLSLVNWLWATKYTDLCYGFMAFRREAVEKLLPHLISKGFEIETEILIIAKKLGLRVTEVPSIELRRRHGKSNLKTTRDGYRILRTILWNLVKSQPR